jgi:hypothetical protein
VDMPPTFNRFIFVFSTRQEAWAFEVF